MKKMLTMLMLPLLTCCAFGQTEKASYKAVADSFKANYNSDNFDAIFASFSPEMQKALPLDRTKEFLHGLKQQAGKITKMDFIKYEQPYAGQRANKNRLFTG